MRLNSLKFRIPIVVILFVLAIILFSFYVIIDLVRGHAVDAALGKNLVICETMSNKIAQYLDSTMQVVSTSARVLSGSPADLDRTVHELNRIYNNYNYFDLMLNTDTEGHLLYTNPPNDYASTHYLYTDRDYFQYVMTYEETYISRLYQSRVLGTPHFVVAAPVFDEDDAICGLIAGGIPLVNVYGVAQENTKAFEGSLRIFDAHGALIADSSQNVEELVVVSDNFEVTMDGAQTDLYSLLGSRREGLGTVVRDGTTYYSAITFVEGTGWMVMIEQSEDVVLREVRAVTGRLGAIMLITAFVALIVGLIMALSITRPIEKLMVQVEALSGGHFEDEGLDNRYDNEIGDLYAAFRDMAVNLDDKVRELRESYYRENRLQQYLGNILMSAATGIFVVDQNSLITIFNRAMEQITGFDASTFIDKHCLLLSGAVGFDFPALMEDMVRSGEDMAAVEQPIQRSDGAHVRCAVDLSTVRDMDRNIVGFMFVVRNVERERVMEEELKRDDRINVLGKFTSSIIHEIGNPLAGLINLMELQGDDAVDEAEKAEILQMVRSELIDLNDIVVNYLNFTRSGGPVDVPVDLRVLLDEIVRILGVEATGKRIAIERHYTDEPVVVKLDRTALKQALVNILRNSIQAIEGSGRITVELTREGDEARIVVSDTGIGISKQAIGQIYEPFFSTKKEGNGLGLSIAYKIIKDSRGSIDVASEMGWGTRFAITLPAAGTTKYPHGTERGPTGEALP